MLAAFVALPGDRIKRLLTLIAPGMPSGPGRAMPVLFGKPQGDPASRKRMLAIASPQRPTTGNFRLLAVVLGCAGTEPASPADIIRRRRLHHAASSADRGPGDAFTHSGCRHHP